MKYLKGSDVAHFLGGVISEKHQQHDFETDLTVAAVERLTVAGAVDFGGSEFAAAGGEPIAPVKKNDDDTYGWWKLAPGTYRLRYNERPDLEERHIAFVQPHERLLAAGADHPTFYFRGPRKAMETLLTVGSAGCAIKENARVSKLLILET